jgi:hypothetical protein
MKETNKVDPRQFCRASLNDLVSKLHEIDAETTPKKAAPNRLVGRKIPQS